MGGGERNKFYPYKVLAMLKWDTNSFEVVLTQELEVLAILKVCVWGGGGAKRFHPLKGRVPKVLRGGGDFWSCDFPIL